MAEEETSFIPLEEALCFPMDKGNVDKIAEVKEVLLRKVQEVEDAGGSPIFTTQLHMPLLKHCDAAITCYTGQEVLIHTRIMRI